MEFLINLAFGLLTFWLVAWAAENYVSVPRPVAFVLGFIFGLVVFFADFADKIV